MREECRKGSSRGVQKGLLAVDPPPWLFAEVGAPALGAKLAKKKSKFSELVFKTFFLDY